MHRDFRRRNAICSTIKKKTFLNGLCYKRMRLYYSHMDEFFPTLSYEVGIHPTHFTGKEEAP